MARVEKPWRDCHKRPAYARLCAAHRASRVDPDVSPFRQRDRRLSLSNRVSPSGLQSPVHIRACAGWNMSSAGQRCVSAATVPNGGAGRQTESHVVLADEDQRLSSPIRHSAAAAHLSWSTPPSTTSLAFPVQKVPEGSEVAYFALGCFWGAEKLFWNTPGVTNTAVGYAGGFTPNPTYQEVCSARTGSHRDREGELRPGQDQL